MSGSPDEEVPPPALSSALPPVAHPASDPGIGRRYGVLAACGGTFLLVTAALAPFHVVPWLPRRIFGALPWMPTSARRVNRALDALPASFTQRGKRFVDLGSGDGVAVIAAAERGMVAHGVELNPTLVALSRFLAWRRASAATFELGNMFAHKLASYDVIMVFGVVPLMPRIGAKIEAEATGPVCVVSHKFPLPSDPWDARQVTTVDDMRIYRFDPGPLPQPRQSKSELQAGGAVSHGAAASVPLPVPQSSG